MLVTMAESKPSEECHLESMCVRELKDYLRKHGAHVSGNKPDLLKRAQSLSKLGLRPLSEIQVEDEENVRQRNLKCFTTPLGERVPEPWNIGTWSPDVESIPTIGSSNLYNYLVLNRNRTFDSNSMKAKRQLKARVFYEDRHVYKILYSETDKNCSHCFVKCKVIPSLPGSASENKKPDYDVWLCMSKVTGQVHSAGCTCSAGEGEACNHIAAFLYALVDISEKKKDGLHSATSSKCKWNMPRKRKLSPKKSQDLVFKKHKFEDCGTKSNDSTDGKKESVTKRFSNLENVTEVNVERFCDKLKDCAPHAAFLLTFEQHDCIPETETKCEDLHNIPFMYCDSQDLNCVECKEHFDSYFHSLHVTEDQCRLIEQNTKGQATNSVWKSSRFGRITSSNFGRVYSLMDKTSPDCTIKSVLDYQEFDSQKLRWGRTHEPAARRTYRKVIQKTHPNMKVHCCGLIVDPAMPHLGSSPDSLLHCSHCNDPNGVLEIKCPHSSRFLTPYEAAKQKTFFCEIVNDRVRLKRKCIYYYQIQGQMAITNRQWCDFFVWTLKGYSIERIFFDKELWCKMYLKLNKFYREAVLPELFSNRVKRGLSLFPN